MKLKKETLEKVERTLSKKKGEAFGRLGGLGFETHGSVDETTISRNTTGCFICEIEELKQTIEELQLIKEAIEEVTGIEL